MDKLDGKIAEDFWQRKPADWQREEQQPRLAPIYKRRKLVQNPSPARFFWMLPAMIDERPTAHQHASSSPPDKTDLDALMPVVYSELRRMARSFLRSERQNHTLQPTALAHEVYLRLAKQRRIDTKDRLRFFGLAAAMMRRILVNHAEAHKAAKRGPEFKLSLDEDETVASYQELDVNLVALHDALNMLSAIDAEKGRIVELRFFGGLTMGEIATFLGRSLATIEREWSLARAWLYREICVKSPKRKEESGP